MLISALGVLLGFVLAIVSRYAIITTTRLVIYLRPQWLLISAVIGVSAGVAGALYPALTAANLDAVEALSYE